MAFELMNAWGDPRGQLFYDFIRVVHHVKPLFFVAENVSGLLQGGQKPWLLSTDYQDDAGRRVHCVLEASERSSLRRSSGQAAGVDGWLSSFPEQTICFSCSPVHQVNTQRCHF